MLQKPKQGLASVLEFLVVKGQKYGQYPFTCEIETAVIIYPDLRFFFSFSFNSLTKKQTLSHKYDTTLKLRGYELLAIFIKIKKIKNLLAMLPGSN